MKRFEFQLESLLTFKQQSEKLARMKEERLRAERNSIQRQITELDAELHRRSDCRQATIGNALAANDFLAERQKEELVAAQMEAALVELRRVESAVNVAAEERKQLNIEIESLETLKREAWAEYRRERSRRADEQLREFILRPVTDAAAPEGVSS